MYDIYYPSHDGVTKIHACIWKPQGEIKGVVQIIHGMCEYAKRYTPFAEYLNSKGYLVCAEDHLGHGESVLTKDDLGYFNAQRSTDIIIADIRALQLAVKKQTKDLPYFIMGHSMGSFFCRKYISLYGKDFNGAIIMGTGFKSSLTLGTALFTVRMNALFKGWRNRSNLIRKLAFGSYNKKFAPARTENDWLSKNAENVDSYNGDEICGFSFTNNGYNILFSIIKQACSHKTVHAVPADLPCYFVAGQDDPVGDYGKGVLKAKKHFEDAGVKDVSVTLYEDSRHEILNDDCREKVMEDILNFLDSHLEKHIQKAPVETAEAETAKEE